MHPLTSPMLLALSTQSRALSLARSQCDYVVSERIRYRAPRGSASGWGRSLMAIRSANRHLDGETPAPGSGHLVHRICPLDRGWLAWKGLRVCQHQRPSAGPGRKLGSGHVVADEIRIDRPILTGPWCPRVVRKLCGCAWTGGLLWRRKMYSTVCCRPSPSASSNKRSMAHSSFRSMLQPLRVAIEADQNRRRCLIPSAPISSAGTSSTGLFNLLGRADR